MRVYKIIGYKNCKRCNQRFGYKVVQQTFCSDYCKHKNQNFKERVEGVTLAYIPPHLLVQHDKV